jgi:hypothetical protein
MIRSWDVPRAAAPVVDEQPLPWDASEVHLWFHDGQAYTCRVSRSHGDLLRVERDGPGAAVGTPVEIQWTHANRGCYAAGTVAAPPVPGAGVSIRIDDSVVGVERRLSVRLPVRVPAGLIAPSGRAYSGASTDLSLGGVCVVVDGLGGGEPISAALRRFGIVRGQHATVVLTLPAGVAGLTGLIVGVEGETGEVRLRFVHHDSLAIEQIGALLRAEQRRIAWTEAGGQTGAGTG